MSTGVDVFRSTLTLWHGKDVHDGTTVGTLDHVPMRIVVYPSDTATTTTTTSVGSEYVYE